MQPIKYISLYKNLVRDVVTQRIWLYEYMIVYTACISDNESVCKESKNP